MPLEAGGKDGELFMFVFVMGLLVFAWCQWSTVYSMSGFCKFCVPVGIIGAISGVYIYIYLLFVLYSFMPCSCQGSVQMLALSLFRLAGETNR